MLAEIIREAKELVDEAGDNATSGLLDDWTDEAEERAWFCSPRFSETEIARRGSRRVPTLLRPAIRSRNPSLHPIPIKGRSNQEHERYRSGQCHEHRNEDLVDREPGSKDGKAKDR